MVLGPGTGLGVGALVAAGGLWVPVPGEGGHVALGPAEADEFPLWANIEPEDRAHIGRGASLRTRPGAALSRGRGDRWREPTLAKPAEITKAALADRCAGATNTVALCRFLGRLAGDMALIFMARGGVYIGGGIPPRILPFLRDGEFRRAFEAKAPHEDLIATIPTYVIVGENPALQGLAAFAREPERFGVNLAGRRWRK